MKSDVDTVAAYLDEAPAERQPRLREIRDLCREVLADHEESMRYGMPSYVRNDVTDFAFASQRDYISLYLMKQDVVAAHQEQLAALDMGKGCLRFKSPEQVDMRLVRSLLEGTRRSAEPPC